MQWGGGGGGGSAAVGNAAAAVACGLADCVVVVTARWPRASSSASARRRRAAPSSGEAALTAPYGVMSPAQRYRDAVDALHAREQGRGAAAQRAIALASYHHAQANPRAVMHGRPLTAEAYDASRWIVEPWRLFDCCMENDGAAALIMVAGRAGPRLRAGKPAYILGVGAGLASTATRARSHNAPLYATSSFTTVAPHLYEMAGLRPQDVDVVQSYENFTGGVLMSLVEHGFFAAGGGQRLPHAREPDRADGGRLPLNTSGGNLAECYMHGLELQIEGGAPAARRVDAARCQDANVSLVIAGPMVTPVSSMLLGSEATL